MWTTDRCSQRVYAKDGIQYWVKIYIYINQLNSHLRDLGQTRIESDKFLDRYRQWLNVVAGAD